MDSQDVHPCSSPPLGLKLQIPELPGTGLCGDLCICGGCVRSDVARVLKSCPNWGMDNQGAAVTSSISPDSSPWNDQVTAIACCREFDARQIHLVWDVSEELAGCTADRIFSLNVQRQSRHWDAGRFRADSHWSASVENLFENSLL